MFGKAHEAPRTSCYFDLSPAKVLLLAAFLCSNLGPAWNLGAEWCMCEQGGAAMEGEATLDISEDVEAAAPSNELQAAGRIINRAVSSAAVRLLDQLLPDDRQDWACSYALANCYKDGQEGVGPHSGKP